MKEMPNGICTVTVWLRWIALFRILLVGYPGLLLRYIYKDLLRLKTLFWLVFIPLFALRNIFLTIFSLNLLSGKLTYSYRMEEKGLIFGVNDGSLVSPYAIIIMFRIGDTVALVFRDGVVTFLPGEFHGRQIIPEIQDRADLVEEGRGG